MAVRRKKKSSPPPIGAAFAVPLSDGRYSACRVLRHAADWTEMKLERDAVLVACSAWIGDAVPNAGDPALRPILHLTHHAWDDKPEILWVSGEPPESFQPIGVIEPAAEERQTRCFVCGGWESLAIQPSLQWRWDHDREAVLAEDAEEKRAKDAARRRSEEERRRQLAKVTLEELAERTFFPRWKKYPPRKATQASRELMRETVERLRRLGKRSPKAKRLEVLQWCIESFNELDAQLRFIETIEREDICEEFDAIVHACGLGDRNDLADEWRDW